MERLTKKLPDGRNVLKEGYALVTNPQYGSFVEGKAIDKLAEYEDAGEQGLLLRLPCEMGAVIYVIPSKVNYDLNIINRHEENNRVYEQTVYSVQMWSNRRYILTTCEGWNCVVSDLYKETWFLTYEEAAQALAEMAKDRLAEEIAMAGFTDKADAKERIESVLKQCRKGGAE